jgi:hypothetical protein
MRYFIRFVILISFPIFFSCSKNDGETGEVFDKKEWCQHVDTTSDLIIFIPDIQIYTYLERDNRYLEAIIDQILELNNNGFKVKAVLQSGDITNRNTIREWEAARRIFSKLANKVPYILCTGNHDYDVNGHCDVRITYYSDYFNYSDNSFFVTSFKKGNYENSFFRISVHNHPFQIFSLEFAPTDEVLVWADSIAKANVDEKGIVLTHAYLFRDKKRFDFSTYGYDQINTPYDYGVSETENINDGEEIWQKLICPNNAIRFVLCGHMEYPDYIGNLFSKNSGNHSCLQMLFDTQSFPNGGNGWMQILEFKSDLKTVNIFTYSAVSGTWMIGSLQHYQFTYD